MKKFALCLFAVAALAFLSVPASAQIPNRTMSQLNGDLSTACAAGNITYQLVIVTDAGSTTDCSTGSGDGTTPSVCWCINGAFAAFSAATSADLSNYVLITKAGQQAITATGAGNDITLTAADKVALSPAVEYEVNATLVDWNITSGSGETCTDDIDTSSDTSAIRDLVCSASAESTLTLRANNSTDAGYARVMVDSQPADLSTVLIQSVPIAGAGSTTAVMVAATSVSVDVAGAADELVVGNGYVAVNSCVFYGLLANYSTISTPAECDTFFDSTIHALCEYNGTAWVKVADGSTGCTAS